MSTIYRIYNSILSDMEDTISSGDKTIKNIEKSAKEKFIKILTHAGKLNNKETKILRNLVDEITDKFKYAICPIDNKTINILIKCSNAKLKKEDFSWFLTNTKEYSFRISWEYVSLDNISDIKLSELEKQADFVSDNKIIYDKSGLICVKLGNLIIYKYKDVIYIKVNNMCRLVFRVCAIPIQNLSVPLNYYGED